MLKTGIINLCKILIFIQKTLIQNNLKVVEKLDGL